MNKSQLAQKFAEMCNLGLDKFPCGITLSLVRNAVAIVSKTAPDWFIEYVGPFFYEKRKEIAEDDVEFFMNRSWSEQYDSWGFMGSALAIQFEATIKTALRHIIVNDQQSLKTIPKSLVAMYCNYIILCQKK